MTDEVRAVFRRVEDDDDWWELESAEHAEKTDCNCDGYINDKPCLCQPLWLNEYVNSVGAADALDGIDLTGLESVVVQGRMVAEGYGEDTDEWFECAALRDDDKEPDNG